MNTALTIRGRSEKQSMLFSNLHSFHFLKTLQSATALPAYIYRRTNNRRSVNNNANIPYANIPQEQIQKPAHTIKSDQAGPLTGFERSPFHELWEPVIIEGRAIRKWPEPPAPVINDVVETKPKQSARFNDSPEKLNTAHTNAKPSPPHQQHRFNKRNVWKPGHGTIEKVDKLSGDIVHLTEEYIDNENFKVVSSI